MSPYLSLLSLLLIAAQARSYERSGLSSLEELKSEHESLIAEMKALFGDVVEGIRGQVDGQVKLLQTTLDDSKQKGLKAINDRYDQGSRHIRSIEAPKVCLEEAQSMLEESKVSSGSNFFRCENLTEAAMDVVSIGAESLTLVTNVLLSLDDVLNGMSTCWSWNPFTFLRCTYGYIKTAISDMYSTFSDLKEFTDKITSLVKDIQNQINYCRNSGEDKALQDTVKSLEHIHLCSQNIKS